MSNKKHLLATPPSFRAFLTYAVGIDATNPEPALAQGDAHVGFGSPALFSTKLHGAEKRSRECGDALFRLQKIARKAKEGDLHCYELLLYATTKLVALLNSASAAQPDFHTMLASHSATWPVQFPYDGGSVRAIQQRLTEASLGFYFKSLDVPKISSDLQLYAVMLIFYIRLLRSGLYSSQSKHVPQCIKLKPLGPETWEKWWEVAKIILNEAYHDLTQLNSGEIEAMKRYDRNKKRDSMNKPISDSIRERFQSLAPALGKLPETSLRISRSANASA